MHHTPDSVYYIRLAEFFKGDATLSDLRPPYAYRVLLPFIAAHGPTDSLDLNFAIINIVCTIIACVVFFSYLKALGSNNTDASFGVLLLVLSFPTFNYTSGVLTDPAGFLFIVAAGLALLTDRLFLFSMLSVAGVCVREASLAMVLVLIIYAILKAYKTGRYGVLISCAAGIPPIIAYLVIRSYFSQLQYFWHPSLDRLILNLTRPISWATVILTILPLALISMTALITGNLGLRAITERFSGRNADFLLSCTVGHGLLFAYSITSAFMSGRFVWPLYVVLIPISLELAGRTAIYRDKVVPLIEKLFKIA
jgi:hypothetical protein